MLKILCLMALTSADKSIVVDLKNFTWIACQNGNVVKSGPASGGRVRGCIENTKTRRKSCRTPVGTFKVIAPKRGRYYRSPTYPMTCNGDVCVPCKGKKCAPMPYAVRFKYSGESFHGSNDRLDRHTSHGCIHLSLEDAIFINQFSHIGMEVRILPY